MVVENLHESVRRARVIYVVGSISSAASIQTPATVDFTDAQHLSMCSATSLCVGDLLAGVLGDLMSLLKSDCREAALTVYRRRAD